MTEEWFKTWFDTKYYHLLYRNRDETEARQFVDALLRFLNPKPNARFIDVACGKGRHSIQLNQNGFSAIGIDLSDNSICIAKKHETDSLHFFVQDIREPILYGPFDFALNLFTSFGYFETINEHKIALQNIYNVLNPKGVLVLDFLNVNHVKLYFESTDEMEIEHIQFDIKKELTDGFITKRIGVTENHERHEYIERVMAFTKEDLTQMLLNVGFKIKSVHGDYQLNDFTFDAPRVIIIAEKN